MQSNPLPLFRELVAINRTFMEANCDRLRWDMVACWESDVSRVANVVKLHQTSIWVTPDRNPQGMMIMKFGPPTDAQLGTDITSESITLSSCQEGDCRFVLGFANDEYTANAVVDQYVSDGTHSAVASVVFQPSHASTRSSRRMRKRQPRSKA